jgi:peptide/nickel transport system substrate-binding protein
LSKLTLAAIAEPDQAKRAADYRQLQQEVQKSSPFVIGLQAKTLIAVRDNINGYVQGINPDMVFYSKVTK